ncbi:RloB family protein [uncultured Actinomyces sp.]|uniref:RloB family protein n=1 Tax=uncultured Actinomyces sp. TaxID=249061 RepID=UPI0028EDA539|nr:RloB family protein [uncultured Actinomyces sp.]
MGKTKQAPTRHSSRGKRGKSFDKAPRPVVILAVEGATEREYLKALNQWRYRGAFAFDFCRNRDKSSLKNLIVSIKRKADDVGRDGAAGAWIVCDVDDNAPHIHDLENWLAGVSGYLRAVALSNPCIEAWFVYHCADVCSSRTASAVVEELLSKWERGAYEKAMEIPQWLIDQTDDACSRVKHRRTSFAKGVTAWDEAPWTDMPELIAWLDQLSPRHSE